VSAKCLECGNTFTVDHGGGFVFHLLRCDKCGRTKAIDFARLGELHLRYLKGLPGPYCVATSEHDKYVREQVDLQPISEEEYQRGVEKRAGKCKCGGKYVFDAPPRCPKCHSTNIKEGGTTIMYD
jgi:Zn finger protein HypA/HybF involved in hydrogenase expression